MIQAKIITVICPNQGHRSLDPLYYKEDPRESLNINRETQLNEV